MLRKPSLIASLMIVSCGAAVASCETPGASFPPAQDLAVKAKPVPPDDVLTSRIAGEQYDNAVEAWGEEGWAQIGRLCRFFDAMKMPGLQCPPTPRPREPG